MEGIYEKFSYPKPKIGNIPQWEQPLVPDREGKIRDPLTEQMECRKHGLAFRCL